MYKIYLDDMRVPTDNSWTIVRNYDQFVKFICSLDSLEKIEVISLDHDLGKQAMDEFFNNVISKYYIDYNNIKDEYTGLDCAKFLVNFAILKKQKLPKIGVHSANPVGSANIMGYINAYLMSQKQPQDCVRWKIENYIPVNE